jgi:regulator of replication initiation timing
MKDTVMGGSDTQRDFDRQFCLERIIGGLKIDKAELIDENERLKEQIRQIHKDLGHEMRDPNGTIWQECARLQAENERLKDALGYTLSKVGGHLGLEQKWVFDVAEKTGALKEKNK